MIQAKASSLTIAIIAISINSDIFVVIVELAVDVESIMWTNGLRRPPNVFSK
jgi:hypothetical protein